MKVFKKVDGTIVNVVEHTLNQLQKDPYLEIHIGTDSQNTGRKTVYSTVIAYRYNSKGVHYIRSTSSIPKIRDMFQRLWKEAEMTIEVAQWLGTQLNVKVQVDFDFNADECFKSSSLVNSTVGWATSLGYKVNIKPDNQIATRAADHSCR